MFLWKNDNLVQVIKGNFFHFQNTWITSESQGVFANWSKYCKMAF